MRGVGCNYLQPTFLLQNKLSEPVGYYKKCRKEIEVKI